MSERLDAYVSTRHIAVCERCGWSSMMFHSRSLVDAEVEFHNASEDHQRRRIRRCVCDPETGTPCAWHASHPDDWYGYDESRKMPMADEEAR